MIKGYSFSGFEQYEQRFERLLIPARKRCSSFTISIWHSPTPILENQRDPNFLALLKNSVRMSLAVGKMVCQVGLPIYVNRFMRRSLGARENGIELGISKLLAGVEQTQVGPEVVFEEVGKSGCHEYT
jgi:hypothetical protein